MDLDTENVVILGQGNVALDVARILLTPISVLKVGNSISAQVLSTGIFCKVLLLVYSVGMFYW